MVTPFPSASQPNSRSAANATPPGFVQAHGPNGEPLPFAINPQTGESIAIQQTQLSPEHQELNNRLNDIVTSVYLGMDHFEALERAAEYGIDRMYGRGFFGRVLAAIERFKTKHGHLRPAMRQTYQGAIASQAAISNSYQQTEATRQDGHVQIAAAKNTAAVTAIFNDEDYRHQTRFLDDQFRRDLERIKLDWQAKLHMVFILSFGASPEVVAQRFVEALQQHKMVLDPFLEHVPGKEKQSILEDFGGMSAEYRKQHALPKTNLLIERIMSDILNTDDKSA